MSHEHHDENQPCLYCHPHTYIRMVQHLIERCLLLHMSQGQCIEALSTRANIQPLITLTVWKELLKVNRDFFRSYLEKTTSPRSTVGGGSDQWESRFKTRKEWESCI
ncbi:hypothetical protein MKW92_019073 [Papaver armeniacum]|nr:hypothetical protein MKW92_040594 [Papaver armeniacum]KAI3941089.1 hypothetical protein MKW92_019073 [Papaver armeniacum]